MIFGLLESSIETKFKLARYFMGVIKPIKVVIVNYPENTHRFLMRTITRRPECRNKKSKFARELFIDADDFMENPPKKYFRLSPGAEVRLKHAYYITCKEVIKDAQGNITELRCEYDPQSRGGSSPDGRRVKGTIQWVSAEDGVKAEIRLYDHLFTVENPDKVEDGKDFTDNINPDSLQVVTDAIVEPALADLEPGTTAQFIRLGYFVKTEFKTRKTGI